MRIDCGYNRLFEMECKEMTEAIIEDKIKDLFERNLGIDRSRIVNAARLIDDLGADSLDVTDLIMDIEDEFDIKISDKDAESMRTVGDVTSYVKRVKTGTE